MTRRRKIQLAIIGTFLCTLAVAAWVGANMFAARKVKLTDMIRIGDLDGVDLICRWDKKQLQTTCPGEYSTLYNPGLFVMLPHFVDQENDTVEMIAEMYGSRVSWIRKSNLGLLTDVHLRQRKEICVPVADISMEVLHSEPEVMVGECSVLHLAARYGNPDICSRLIAAGMDPNSRSSKGVTPVHFAASGHDGGFECLERLLEAGGNPNAVADAGIRPIHCAIQPGNLRTVALLLNTGASFKAETASGMTPEDLCTHGCADILTLLLRRSGRVPGRSEKLHMAYCSIRPGMTGEQVSAIAGKPDQIARPSQFSGVYWNYNVSDADAANHEGNGPVLEVTFKPVSSRDPQNAVTDVYYRGRKGPVANNGSPIYADDDWKRRKK